MDRAWGPIVAAACGGAILAVGAGLLPRLGGSALVMAGLVLMFVGVAATAIIRESRLAPVVASAAMMGAVAGFGATGLGGIGVLGVDPAYAGGAMIFGLIGLASLPWLLRDVRGRTTEEA